MLLRSASAGVARVGRGVREKKEDQEGARLGAAGGEQSRAAPALRPYLPSTFARLPELPARLPQPARGSALRSGAAFCPRAFVPLPARPGIPASCGESGERQKTSRLKAAIPFLNPISSPKTRCPKRQKHRLRSPACRPGTWRLNEHFFELAK